ncbi:MAG: amidohydrolase [Candidatus Omnitrophica bacterium]|nr:amidohydrolase [Candidatus Omnitrophota bacterium]
MEKSELLEKIKQETAKVKDDVIAWRRHFHKYPELGFEEYKTSEKIRSVLKKYEIPFKLKAKTGVVAGIDRKAGITIGLRADMDALPVEEKTGLPFASVNKGIMHACGHDGHTAVLLGTAAVLKKLEKHLNVNVKFIFQPSEEKPPGGAPAMIKEGVLKGMDYLTGFHFFSDMPLYKVWIGKGPVMANTDSFRITIKGKGGHGSAPHLAKDPVICAACLVENLQTIPSRCLDPMKAGVLSVCKINGGSAFNIIPETVELEGTVRTLENKIREKIIEEMRLKIKKICESFGCKGELEYNNYSPSCLNDAKLSEKLKGLASAILPAGNVIDYHPIMGGEDFAFFSQKVPSSYLFIGMGDKCGAHHSGNFTLDERILPYTVNLLSSLIIEFPYREIVRRSELQR